MRPWPAIIAAACSLAVVVPVAHHLATAADVPLRAAKSKGSSRAPANDPTALNDLQFGRIHVGRTDVTAPGPSGRVARLTVDPQLQRETLALYREHKVPEGATVLMDLKTGRVLVYASQQGKGAPKDMCADASAPAASVFKIVTASALVEYANLTPQTRQCYHGGSERLNANDLVDNPQKDKWCATLSEAMGRSLNTVFARLALRNLDAPKLKTMAGSYGFGFPFQLDAPVETSEINIPEGDLAFARTAAGFWNTTLSPVQAVMLASAVALDGAMVKPTLVKSVVDSMGVSIYKAAEGRQIIRKTMKPETARAVREMMDATVSTGTGYKAFHDAGGKSFLPGIRVAGKTGTLTRAKTEQYYTWFVGFAPSDAPQVAIATLAVNRPQWTTRANVLARDVLRAYFHSKGAPGVTRPH
jgi:cell division protein FtsI/penicillin-binding protein 2